MRLGNKACVAMVCFMWARLVMSADWAPTWVIEGDPTLSTLASKSEVDACLGRTNRYMPKLPDHALVMGVYIEPTGQPVSVAVLSSSGFPDLDKAIKHCIRQARFKPESTGGKTEYRMVSMAWKAQPLPTSCDPAMTPAATVTINLLRDKTQDYDALPDLAESTVCGCLNKDEKNPSAPAVLSSSGNAREDEFAKKVMERFSAERWSQGIPGCAAVKVRFVK
jgi:TonB family protein